VGLSHLMQSTPGAPLCRQILLMLVLELRHTACSAFSCPPVQCCAGRSLVDACSDLVSLSSWCTLVNPRLLGALGSETAAGVPQLLPWRCQRSVRTQNGCPHVLCLCSFRYSQKGQSHRTTQPRC
jgi:hypothetical protein